MEIWKDIPGYEGYYKVSNLGRVRSLNKLVVYSNGRKQFYKGKILKQSDRGNGYLRVGLSKNKKQKTHNVHTLVAIAFCNYSKGREKRLVCDHVNNIRTDNRAVNLKMITPRQNVVKDTKRGSSKYVGVNRDKGKQKWKAEIWLNGKNRFLGYFDDEYQAHLEYQKRLKQIKNENRIAS